MLELISTLGLSPIAFEVNNSAVLPFKWSRLKLAPGSPRLCQAFQRAQCVSVPRDSILLPAEGEVSAGRGREGRNLCQPAQQMVEDGVHLFSVSVSMAGSFGREKNCCSGATLRHTVFATQICPLCIYLLTEFSCMFSKCHLDHSYPV